MKKLISAQLIKFLLVGIVNSIFGYGCFALFLFFNLGDALALFLATVLGVLFNYKSVGLLVFNSKSGNKLFFRFLLVYIFVYLVNLTGIRGFSYLGLPAYLGGLFMLLPVALLAFLLNRNFVFKYA